MQVKTLETLINENVWQPRFSAWLFSTFSAIALCLSAIGIYGVVAYVTASHRRDFGIRVALGANRAELLRLATLQSLTPVIIGACLGGISSYWTGKWISSLLYKTHPFDPGTELACAGILLFLALAAIVGPALRAAHVVPVNTLRHE